MKSKSKFSRVHDRYGMIESLESRIAPAAFTPGFLPTSSSAYKSVTAGGSLLLKAGQVLTTGSGQGGIYLMYVEQGQVLVHTTDLNQNGQLDFNEITGLSVGNGARIVSFVDIHGDIVTDLNPDGTITDSDNNLANGRDGRVLLDSNIAGITLRSLAATDFAGTTASTPAELVNQHLALTSYSIYGNIYAGGGVGLANDTTSGVQIDNSGAALQAAKYSGALGVDFYQATQAQIGSIYAGTAASGQNFSFGSSGSPTDLHNTLLSFVPAPGEAGASIYNVSANAGTTFNVGTIEAGNGGFNAPGGNVTNIVLDGSNSGVYKIIAGNAGNGTTGHNGGSIVNFSEVGATLSEVVLQSGNGGAGLTGTGGDAGAINLNPAAPIALNAHVLLNYGSGGDGYNKGGAGGGTTTGTFTTPTGQVTEAINLVATYHPIGSIGSTKSIDFNGDGFSDMVYSTINPNQIVVALGGQNTSQQFNFDSAKYIYLNSPAQVDSIVVGDFTGNGHPDIAVASSTGNVAGIEVFLSKYDAKGNFIGFSDPIYTQLPALTDYGFYNTTVPITKLVAGDFNGDGVVDLAVLARETVAGSNDVHSVLIFLNGVTDATHPGGTGYFYADFSNLNQPFIDFGDQFNPTQSIFKATALQKFVPGNGRDVIIEADAGANGFNVLKMVATNLNGFGTTPEITGGAGFGKVDTDRDVGPKHINDVNFDVQDLAIIQDPVASLQNNADIIAVSVAPQGFLTMFQGNGVGGFAIQTVAGGDQAGFHYGDNKTAPKAIVTVPDAVTGYYSDVAILDYRLNGADEIYTFIPLVVTNPVSGAVVSELTAATIGQEFGVLSPDARSGNIAFDTYDPYPVTNPNVAGSGPLEFGFITADPLSAYPNYQGFEVTQAIGPNNPFGVGDTLNPFKVAGFFFNAGSGGNSQSGAGGAGGSFGQTLEATAAANGGTITGTGSLSVVLPDDLTFEGTARFIAGNGGNGFSGGGAGGSLTGISLTYATGTATLDGTGLLFAGNGGQSLTGVGGRGGSLSELYITSGELFVAGNGGIGITGGSGGSLVGNTQQGLVSALTNDVNPDIILKGGDGATGINNGGNGGSIDSFVNLINPFVGAVGGFLNYTAGSGGNAVAGQGGTGGSVINSSPNSQDNNLAGDIYLQGGAGGSGLHGGSGGGVITFAELSTIKDIPTSSAILGGAGGNSTLGTAGAGGDVSNIQVNAAGVGSLYTFDFSHPNLLFNDSQAVTSNFAVTYNRIVAGEGGTSLGGTGGAGGSVNTIQTASASADSQYVVVAGAGGAGLNAGGAGGSVTSANVDAGSATGKVLIVAGDGGASNSAAPLDPTDPSQIAQAIGGVNGPGGNGGSITGFTQDLSTNTHVDLIAGNGGATLNHGVAAGNATVDNSGHGGSITNVSVTGSIGNVDSGVAIKSYNDILNGQTMQDFVNTYILGNPAAPLNDTVGNVGLVAGAAGRTLGDAPSNNGISGYVTNVHAANIMSMIAGNVDQVDLIQSITNYGVTINGGILGAEKDVYFNPQAGFDQYNVGGTPLTVGPLNYISPAGTYSNSPLPGGGELVDGAIVAKNARQPLSPRDF